LSSQGIPSNAQRSRTPASCEGITGAGAMTFPSFMIGAAVAVAFDP
jgi:hypothetical protein